LQRLIARRGHLVVALVVAGLQVSVDQALQISPGALGSPNTVLIKLRVKASVQLRGAGCQRDFYWHEFQPGTRSATV